jgi:2-keto-3-deoxy-L-rhamnonate aldolase RhmA
LAAALLLAAGAIADASAQDHPMTTGTGIADLLRSGEAVFGIFPGAQTAEGGAAMAANSGMDFVFYSLENGPFDIPTMRSYMAAMAEALGPGAPRRPMALRIPPIGDEPDLALARVQEGLSAGVDAIVVPHVVSASNAAVAVSALGSDAWPGNPNGKLVSMLIVEDQAGIASVESIAAATGVSVVFAGPGDLRRAYDGDMEAVENAIQTVLAACKANEVACGITAGVDDIAERLDQGFRVFIVTQPEALAVGKRAAGR